MKQNAAYTYFEHQYILTLASRAKRELSKRTPITEAFNFQDYIETLESIIQKARSNMEGEGEGEGKRRSKKEIGGKTNE